MDNKYNTVEIDTDDEYEEIKEQIGGDISINSPIILNDINYDSDEEYIDTDLYKNNEDELSDIADDDTVDKPIIDENDPIKNLYFEQQLYHIPTMLHIQEKLNIYKKLILKDICKRHNKPFEQYAFLLKK